MKKLLTAAAFAAFTGFAGATVVAPVTYHGHNLSGGGGISSIADDNDYQNPGPAASKITKPDANDPSTWTATGQRWQDDWQGNGPLAGATNGKVGWTAMDFGSSQALGDIFIWNVSEATAQGRRVNTYNIYYSDNPTVALVSGNGNAAASLDYDFSSGNWTQLGGTRSLLQWQNGTGADGQETLGITARYIGLEFLTYGGDSQRVGLNEVVFTQGVVTAPVPEPSTTALLGLGALALVFRRRK